MNPKDITPFQALKVIELPENTLSLVKNENDLETFKEKVKKQRKLLAKKYHPDKFPSQHIMNEINAICDLFLQLKIQRRPQPIVVRYTVRTNCSGTTGGTTTSTYAY